MKNKTLLLTVVFFASITSLVGQKIIQGKVLAQNNKTAIAYANIGILNSNVGSISNEDGSFSISVPTYYFNDTLLFAALGHTTRRIPVSLINTDQSLTVLLAEKVIQLESVTVTAKREKKKNF
jgi:hypothetical protein